MGTSEAPVSLLYGLMSLIVIGLGVAIIVWETGATRRALQTRWGFLLGGVALIVFGGLVAISQAIPLLLPVVS
ncbi:hypothetical protein QDR37_02475 [Amnibacterium sp. CER49]|uniref:hypothetical protein n=1 Tax=Amnibacterium sp. CER49 TaxID=3039161 RepID=UPI002447F7B9|nr:hypothetical protein [Amnibacterium sp. CER49]MDH2442803.1 hypothetical protein [Amnibacterium sp. CER49]